MSPEWLEEAKFEFSESVRYYHWQEPGLGDSFADHVEATVTKIMKDPLFPKEFDPPFRKVVTRRFPFQVVYVIEEGAVLIVAVMHQHREPDYWRERLDG